MTVIVFIIVLAVLIFVHELGHFLLARINGIRVDAFAIGFGPKLISFTKGETKYSLNLIPFGGYVRIFGENPDEESTIGADSARSFINKPRWRQATVLAAGVLFNFVFAALLYMIVFSSGVTATRDGFDKYTDRFSNDRVMVTYVGSDSPAHKAGIKTGDVILSVTSNSGMKSSPLDIASIQDTINSSANNPLTFEYKRGNEISTLSIIPEAGIVADRYAIGISMSQVADLKLSFFSAIVEGIRYTYTMIRETIVGLYGFLANIIKGQADFSDVAGPIGIAGIVGGAAELGFTYLLMITAIISINLGVINLIPFPALDGGRILFVAIEGIIRRPIPHKFQNMVNAVGFFLLMALMITVTYKDILKLI